MTGSPFQDAAAVDTNVFSHLLNPQNNPDGHINDLLAHLFEQQVALLVDDGGRITGEYERSITPLIQRLDEARNERQILRYWMAFAPSRKVEVSERDDLMAGIEQVISGDAAVDRIFVYVAFKEGKVLISNDERDIVFGSDRGRGYVPRRERLLQNTQDCRPPGADILTAREAYEKTLS